LAELIKRISGVIMERLGIAPLVCQVEHPEFGLIGFVVVNSSAHRRAVGGVRMAPNVTVQETKLLARAMTYKFGFLNMPCGGAKTGIVTSPEWFPEHKKEVIQYFGSAVRPLLKNRVYTPGPDMGFGAVELWDLFHGAGFAQAKRPDENFKKVHGTTGYTTGITVYLSGKSALQGLGIDIKGAKISIEGFGKVGATAAQLFYDRGAVVVAISNVSGAIYNSDGLDVTTLISLLEKGGDEAVLTYPHAEKISHQQLLELPVDVLIPSARIWSINNQNIDKINCRIISSAANAPIHPEVWQKLLRENAIIYIPDFVANCGGVFGANLHGRRETKLKLLFEKFSRMTDSLMEESLRSGISVNQLAEQIAERNILANQNNSAKAIRDANLLDLAASLSIKPYIPGQLSDIIMRWYVKHWLPKISTDNV
jgi:glutamate dehydrogenase/leucine dehydrogenase